jgi:hypothetical protein
LKIKGLFEHFILRIRSKIPLRGAEKNMTAMTAEKGSRERCALLIFLKTDRPTCFRNMIHLVQNEIEKHQMYYNIY